MIISSQPNNKCQRIEQHFISNFDQIVNNTYRLCFIKTLAKSLNELINVIHQTKRQVLEENKVKTKINFNEINNKFLLFAIVL